MKSSCLTTNSRLGLEIRAQLKELVYCPVSGGQPLRCTKESFARACGKQISLFDNRALGFNGHCGVCRGENIPKNVEFIELEQLKGGEMPAFSRRITEKTEEKRQKTDNSGKNSELPKTPTNKVSDLTVCECCGRSASKLRPALGPRACASCGVMISMANNRPEVVIAQLERLGKLNGRTAEGSSGEQVAKLKYALAACEDQLAEAEQEVVDWKNSHDQRLKELQQAQQEILDWGNRYAALGDDLRLFDRNLDNALKALAAERETSTLLAGKIESMIDAELYGRKPVALEGNTAPMVSLELFNLAVDTLAGRVTGIDADRLNALRGVM